VPARTSCGFASPPLAIASRGSVQPDTDASFEYAIFSAATSAAARSRTTSTERKPTAPSPETGRRSGVTQPQTASVAA
jgi:hypothetical protein